LPREDISFAHTAVSDHHAALVAVEKSVDASRSGAERIRG